MVDAVRCTLLALAGAAGGCLYVGGINHAPEGRIEVESQSRLSLGGTARLRAAVVDPDGDTLHYAWRIAGMDLAGTAFEVNAHGDPIDGGVGHASDQGAPLGQAERFALPLRRRGTFEVNLAVTDAQGAALRLSRAISVSNQPPVVSAELLHDPDRRANGFPEHGLYWVTADLTRDPDDPLACGSIAWKLLSPVDREPALWRRVPCAHGLDRLQFRFARADAAIDFAVEVSVTDPLGLVATQVLRQTMTANRPPCLIVEPYTPVVYVIVDDDEVQPLLSAFADDDVAEFRYRWFKAEVDDDGSVGPYQRLQHSGSAYRVPDQRPATRAKVRLMVLDSAEVVPNCSAGTDLCAMHPALPAGCYQWVTWEVYFT